MINDYISPFASAPADNGNLYVTVDDYTTFDRPGVLYELSARPYAVLLVEVDMTISRGARVFDNTNGTTAIYDGTISIDGDGDFLDIMLGEPVLPGTSGLRETIKNGICTVWGDKLIYPVRTITNAVDGPDAGSDTVAENAAASVAATAALKAQLIAQMAEKTIVIK